MQRQLLFAALGLILAKNAVARSDHTDGDFPLMVATFAFFWSLFWLLGNSISGGVKVSGERIFLGFARFLVPAGLAAAISQIFDIPASWIFFGVLGYILYIIIRDKE